MTNILTVLRPSMTMTQILTVSTSLRCWRWYWQCRVCLCHRLWQWQEGDKKYILTVSRPSMTMTRKGREGDTHSVETVRHPLHQSIVAPQHGRQSSHRLYITFSFEQLWLWTLHQAWGWIRSPFAQIWKMIHPCIGLLDISPFIHKEDQFCSMSSLS